MTFSVPSPRLTTRMQTRNTWTKDVRIPSDTEAGRAIVEEILAELRKRAWPEGDIFAVHLALEEAIVNAIKHGNQLDTDKMVEFQCRLGAEELCVRVADEGPGFDPNAVPDPTLDENLACPSGRGVMLMRGFMDTVEFNERGNAVQMTKRRSLEDGD